MIPRAALLLTVVAACSHSPAPGQRPAPRVVQPTPQSAPYEEPSALTRSRCSPPSREVTAAANSIIAGARSYFTTDIRDYTGRFLPSRFPLHEGLVTSSTAGAAVRTGWTPRVPCCQQPGKHCPPDVNTWSAPIWQALRFHLDDDPYTVQVWYESQGTDREATFTVKVRVDPGCSGEYCVYSAKGAVDQDSMPTPVRLRLER